MSGILALHDMKREDAAAVLDSPIQADKVEAFVPSKEATLCCQLEGLISKLMSSHELTCKFVVLQMKEFHCCEKWRVCIKPGCRKRSTEAGADGYIQVVHPCESTPLYRHNTS